MILLVISSICLFIGSALVLTINIINNKENKELFKYALKQEREFESLKRLTENLIIVYKKLKKKNENLKKQNSKLKENIKELQSE